MLNVAPKIVKEIIQGWEKDYKSMQENMISGTSLLWTELLDNIKEIQKSINN